MQARDTSYRQSQRYQQIWLRSKQLSFDVDFRQLILVGDYWIITRERMVRIGTVSVFIVEYRFMETWNFSEGQTQTKLFKVHRKNGAFNMAPFTRRDCVTDCVLRLLEFCRHFNSRLHALQQNRSDYNEIPMPGRLRSSGMSENETLEESV